MLTSTIACAEAGDAGDRKLWIQQLRIDQLKTDVGDVAEAFASCSKAVLWRKRQSLA